MTVLLSLALLSFMLYTFARQIDQYNNLIFTRYRFRYFELRDRLALLVVSGAIQESSWEYQHIINALNHHIRTVETTSIRRIARVLSDFHTSQEEKRKIRVFEKNIQHKEVIAIVVDFMKITDELLSRNSKAELYFLGVIISAAKCANRGRGGYEKPKKALDELQTWSSKLTSRLEGKAA